MKYINEPNLNISDVFRKVKQEVNTESEGKQLPSVVDNSIGGDFYFERRESSPGDKTENLGDTSTLLDPGVVEEIKNGKL